MNRRQMLLGSGVAGAAFFGQAAVAAGNNGAGRLLSRSVASSGSSAAEQLGGQVRGYAQLRVTEVSHRTVAA